MIIYIILLFIIIYFIRKIYQKKECFTLIKPVQLKRPFLNCYAVKTDNTEILTNIIFITHPFTRDTCIVDYNKGLENGCVFLGLTSYLEFPKLVSNPFDILSNPEHKAWTDYDYCDLVDGWLYCFRNKDSYINCDKPSILLSESDFTNHLVLKPEPNIIKEFDFILICLKDNDTCSPGWQSYNRGWTLAEKFLDIMCNKFKLKGLLIGRINCKLPETYNVELTDFLEYAKFIKQYQRCKFAVFFNTTDASPRCASESLVFDLPVLMNENILGGWKYIKSGESGELFNETNFEEKLKFLLDNLSTYKPRKYYIKNFGMFNSGVKLKEFVQSIYDNSELNFNPDDFFYLKPSV